MDKQKAILYINQFFGQIGGEEKAEHPPEIHEGLVGPATVYQEVLGDAVQITHTVICGDSYIGSCPEKALNEIVGFLSELEFDVFFAGPAFIAGRYGAACASVCKAVSEKFRVPVFTSMNEENPGVEMFRKDIYIFKGSQSARNMREDVEKVCKFALKVLGGEELLPAADEGYFGRGIRKEVFIERSSADRAVDMLLAKLNKKSFETEMPMLLDEIPKPVEAIKDLSEAKIALITTGGIVPAGNPDKIQSSSATLWAKYTMEATDKLNPGEYICIHSGFDNHLVNENPNIVAPLDVLREMEGKGMFKELYPYFYTTTGTGTAQSIAANMADEIGEELLEAKIDAIILTST